MAQTHVGMAHAQSSPAAPIRDVALQGGWRSGLPPEPENAPAELLSLRGAWARNVRQDDHLAASLVAFCPWLCSRPLHGNRFGSESSATAIRFRMKRRRLMLGLDPGAEVAGGILKGPTSKLRNGNWMGASKAKLRAFVSIPDSIARRCGYELMSTASDQEEGLHRGF